MCMVVRVHGSVVALSGCIYAWFHRSVHEILVVAGFMHTYVATAIFAVKITSTTPVAV